MRAYAKGRGRNGPSPCKVEPGAAWDGVGRWDGSAQILPKLPSGPPDMRLRYCLGYWSGLFGVIGLT